MEKIMNSDFEVRLARLEKLGGDVTKVYNSDFEVSLAILEKLSGQPQNANDYNSVYEIDVEILKYEGGGSPTPPTPTEPVEDTIWFENGTTSSLYFTFYPKNINAKDVKVSQDGENYVSVSTEQTLSSAVPSNSRIYLKYTPTNGVMETKYKFLNAVGGLKIGGELKNAGIPYMYYGMFSGASVTDISELTIESESVSGFACSNMFKGCKSLKNTCKINFQKVNQKSFASMFEGCISLTDCYIDDLGAEIDGENAYDNMFKGCTRLKNAPKLSYAGPMTYMCYYCMFQGCSSLIEAPELPSTVVADYCYNSMFNGCTSLTTAPTVLPAETVGGYSYYQMFRDCTALTKAPDIMATSLKGDSMNSMFLNCTSLTTPPSDLYANYDEIRCYQSMFNGCTSLTKTPKIHLREITAASSCYQMFYNCTSLNEIYIETLTYKHNNDTSTYNIFSNVGETGTVYLPKNIDKDMWVIGSYGLPSGWTIDQTVIDCFPENILIIKNEDTDVNHITLSGSTTPVSSAYEKSVFFYSTDNGQTYNEFKVMNRISFDVALGIGESLYIKGFYNIRLATLSAPSTHQWRSSGKISISGEYKNGGKCILHSAFNKCKNLIDASGFVVNIPLIYYECTSMFSGCDALVHPCQLPQTTVGEYSYYSMFNNCIALTETPELPATTLNNYSCYNMFAGCTNIRNTPRVFGKILKSSSCQYMFERCSKIENVEIYAEIYPFLALKSMFENCSSLKNVYFNGLVPLNGIADGWLSGVSATGTFYYNPNTNWALTVERGTSTIPANWDVQPWLTE